MDGKVGRSEDGKTKYDGVKKEFWVGQIQGKEKEEYMYIKFTRGEKSL